MPLPKGLQPIFTNHPYCSICESQEVHFETMHQWEEIYRCCEAGNVKILNWAMKRYCKECFEEYGGEHVRR